MLATAATTLSALQKCFRLQPQHSQLCRNASHCSHSTLSFAEMLPTAATALSVKCNNIQIPKFRTEHFSSFVCSCVLHADAISRPRKGDPTLSGPVVNLSYNISFFSAVKHFGLTGLQVRGLFAGCYSNFLLKLISVAVSSSLLTFALKAQRGSKYYAARQVFAL